MPLRFPSRDPRLLVGGLSVLGRADDPASRTIDSLQRTFTPHNYPRTVVGDSADRHGYLERGGMQVSVSGFYDGDHGIQPMFERGTPGPAGTVTGLPVTFSMHSDDPASASSIAQTSQWAQEQTTSSNDQPVMVSAEGSMSTYRPARCIFGGTITGGGEQVSAGLSQATRRIPIRATADRLFVISGQTQFTAQMADEDVRRYLREDDDVRFLTGNAQSRVTGNYRVANIQRSPGVTWDTVVFDTIPAGGSVAAFTLSDRQSVDGLSIIDTFTGARSALVHVSRLTPHDGETLGVSIQGQAPGSSAWAMIGTEQTAPTAAGADFAQAFWFDLPESTRGLGSVRVRLRFLTSANVPGARTDYTATVRADFAPRVVHH